MGLPDPNDVAAYDELEQRRIGGPQPLTGPIELRDYDPRWPDLYAEHAARLQDSLGDRVVRVEHVGSTSVPGLAAKPNAGCPETERMVRFRGWLRADDADAKTEVVTRAMSS